MRKIAVIDSETDPFKYARFPAPFIWGFYDGKQYRAFYSTSDLITFLQDQKLIVYAHNGGKFDFHFLLEYMIPFDDITIINGRLAKFKIALCEFRDSFNILPVPLSEYKKDEIDYSLMEESVRDKPENKKKIEKYLENDCVYLYDLVTTFIENYGCHITQATASFKYWLKLSDRKAPISDHAYYEVLKPFYYGGRVECFYKGIVDFHFNIADINSAYPYAMLQAHPIGTEYDIITEAELLEDQKEVIVGNYFYKVQCISKGAFPYHSDDGSLFFPNDFEERIYHITGWELKAAIDTDTISFDWKLLEVIYHYEYCDFADYINYWYEIKLEAKRTGDIATYIFAKIFMNALYGKFAANPDNYSSFIIIPPQYAGVFDEKEKQFINLKLHQPIKGEDEDGYVFSGLLGPWALAAKELDEENKRFYNVATSASITGFVRAYLWRAIRQCNNILYCDTDSIGAVSFGNLDLGSKLGQWEIEGECQDGGVAGKKLYAFHYTDDWIAKMKLKAIEHGNDPSKIKEWKIATKGVKLTYEQVLDICRGKIIRYEPDVPTYSVHHDPRFTERNIKMT